MQTTKVQIRLRKACAFTQWSVPLLLAVLIHLLAISKSSRLYLASEAEQAGLSLTWSQTPKTGFLVTWLISTNVLSCFHDKTNIMACAPSKDSDQPGHLPSLIIVFAVRMMKAWTLSYPLIAQRRLWSETSLGAQVSLLVLSRRGSHVLSCFQCPQCRSVYHNECKTDNRPCPKCQRRLLREASIDLEQSSHDLASQYLHIR